MTATQDFTQERVLVSLTALGPCSACDQPITTYWSVGRWESTADDGYGRNHAWCTRCATDRGYAHMAIWCEAMQAIDRAMRAAPDQAMRDHLGALTGVAAEHFAVWRKADDPDVAGHLADED